MRYCELNKYCVIYFILAALASDQLILVFLVSEIILLLYEIIWDIFDVISLEWINK